MITSSTTSILYQVPASQGPVPRQAHQYLDQITPHCHSLWLAHIILGVQKRQRERCYKHSKERAAGATTRRLPLKRASTTEVTPARRSKADGMQVVVPDKSMGTCEDSLPPPRHVETEHLPRAPRATSELLQSDAEPVAPVDTWASLCTGRATGTKFGVATQLPIQRKRREQEICVTPSKFNHLAIR